MEKHFRKSKHDSESLIRRLNNALDTKMHQYKMLCDTLDELFDKGYKAGGVSADMIKRELDNTKAEITQIREEIAAEEERDYCFYDSIVKQSKAAEYAYAEKKKENPEVYSRYDEFKKDMEEIRKEAEGVKDSFSNKYLNEINENLDTMAKSNRFLVHIDVLGIPTTMVKSVCYNDEKKELAITVYDFVKNVYGKKYPLMRLLSEECKRKDFSFSITHLDAKDKVLYTETYEECKIKEVQRGILDYSFSEISTVEILISYDNVIYEAD